MLNCGLNLFKVFGLKYTLDWIENAGLKSRMLYCLRFMFLLDVQANLHETSPFFICPNDCPKHLLTMFIVLWMYNFSFSYTCVAYLPVSCIGAGQRILPAVTYSKNCSQFSNVTRGSELPYFSSAYFFPRRFWLPLPPSCVYYKKLNMYFSREMTVSFLA